MSEGVEVRLREWRTRAGLTQAALAEAVGVSRKTVNTVENGVFVPSTTLALQLADFFGCKVEDLFSLHGWESNESVRAEAIH
jgi:putative transcriptional regulator